jgi:hypothetical protein
VLKAPIRKSIISAQILRLPGAPTFLSARSACEHKSRQKCRRSFGFGFAGLGTARPAFSISRGADWSA